jgi:GntR family transcriptional regulator
MISINYQDSRPIYEQIVSGYQKLIFRGVLRPDERIPSVRSMAATLTANPNTVQKAYAELERQGFIYTVRGRGNFVCGDPRLIETKQKELLTVIEKALLEAGEIGLDPEEVLRQAAEGFRKRQAQ